MWKIKTLFLEKRKRKKKKEVVLSDVCCRAWEFFPILFFIFHVFDFPRNFLRSLLFPISWELGQKNLGWTFLVLTMTGRWSLDFLD